MRIQKTKTLITLASMATLIAALYIQPAFADMEGSGSKGDHKGYESDHKGMGAEHGKPEGSDAKGKEGYAHGEGYGHGDGHGHGHHFLSHIIKHKDKLALTADQVTGLEKLQADYKKQATDIFTAEMAEHKELHALAHAENVDEAAMNALADKMVATESKEIHAMIATKIAALKILTADQRKKMKAMHEERKADKAPKKK